MTKPLCYLASPYTHELKSVMHERFLAAAKATADLIAQGHLVFSPILHGVPLVEYADLGHLWADWENINREWITRCDGVWVLKITGWDNSVGVRAEVEFALSIRKPLKIVVPTKWRVGYPDAYTVFEMSDVTLNRLLRKEID